MPYPHILHHGAIDGVTGSCHQLMMDAHSSLLIDCGLFQGSDQNEAKGEITFSLQGVDTLVVTHVHADHVGRIPYLLAAGFKGPIICSEPSAKLLPLVLEDAFKLEFSRDARTVQRYLQQVRRQIIAIPFDQWFCVSESPALHARIRLQQAGHILGSAFVECDVRYLKTGTDQRIVFSGDLGAPHAALIAGPRSPERADILILEGTYGDRLHEDREKRRALLEHAIDKALEDHGTILIPAFSIGRTQDLLYEIEDILHRKSLVSPRKECEGSDESLPINWPQVPVIIDSPLASRLTEVYRELETFWSANAQQRVSSGRKPLHFRQLITIDSHAKHMQTVNYLSSTGRPAIVIAANGMCSNGRIVNYLKAMLDDPRHNVLFIGYQARGTPRYAIQKYGPDKGYVELDGETCSIRAGITTLGGYSAHADQSGLLSFVSGMHSWPRQIQLVHGEISAKQALARELTKLYTTQNLPIDVLIPTSDPQPALQSQQLDRQR